MAQGAPKPIVQTPTGGLILDRPLDAIGAQNAIDLLDVDWEGGRLRSRMGASRFTAKAAAANYQALFVHSDTRLLAQRGNVLAALSRATGEELASTAAIHNGFHIAAVRMGTPAASFSYIADSEHPLWRFDGTTFTTPEAKVDGVGGKAMPIGVFLANWAEGGNRLVVAGTAGTVGGPGGIASHDAYVWFSNPGSAEEWESTAYVQLDPGDGEEIVGCVVWNGQVFVLKETKLFVFYGVSLDTEGKPEFNYRRIDLRTRILRPGSALERGSGEYMVAGTEGVYFVSNDGLWVTTGGEPSLLSEALDPLASSRALVGPAATTFGSIRWSNMLGIAYVDNTVFVGLGAASIERLLKFDLRTLRWTVWKANFNGMAVWNEETTLHRERLFFSSAVAADQHVYFYTPAVDTDPTVAMDPRWQSGFDDLGSPDEKTVVNMKLFGEGAVDVKVAEDFGALGAAKTFQLGAGGAIAQKEGQRGQSATLFSHQFSGAAPWSVQRMARYLRETRAPGTQKP